MIAAAVAGCDMRSGTAKEEMEKFSGTPTPALSPTPPEKPIDPAEVINVDAAVEGDKITINGSAQKKTVACTKLNRVMISGGSSTISITGACGQIMVNGNGNQLTIDAATEIVLNGDKNTVQYSRYVNGKRPVIKDNAGSNTIEKVSFVATPGTTSNRKNGK